MSKPQDETQKHKGESAYAKKRAGGQQMYGPGCCANKISEARMRAVLEQARAEGRLP